MASADTRRYNLNGLVQVEVTGPRSYLEYFDNEYSRIAQRPLAAPVPTVCLRIVDRIGQENAKSLHYKGLFHFRYAVTGLDSASPVIEFERHWLDRLYTTPVGAFVQGQLLEPVIYQKLLENGVLFMHCAGVAKDGEAFVFPAHGGTGKTTLSLALMRNGYDLMGDDLLMVDTATGTVHPYARPLHLFTYNLKTLTVPPRIRAAIAIKDVIRSAIALTTGKRFLISTRAHADEFLEVSYASPSRLGGLIFLRRDGEQQRFDLSRSDDLEEAIEMIINSADLNLSLAENIGFTDRLKETERKVIGQVLALAGEMRAVNARALTTDADRIALLSD